MVSIIRAQSQALHSHPMGSSWWVEVSDFLSSLIVIASFPGSLMAGREGVLPESLETRLYYTAWSLVCINLKSLSLLQGLMG